MIEKIINNETMFHHHQNQNDLLKNYVNFLKTQGYSSNSAQRYLGCIKHYIKWAFSNKRNTLNINVQSINNFLKKHLKGNPAKI